MSRMYCQSQDCDWSYEAYPSAALPSTCPKCGSMSFASEPKMVSPLGRMEYEALLAKLTLLRAVGEAAEREIALSLHLRDWRPLRDALAAWRKGHGGSE